MHRGTRHGIEAVGTRRGFEARAAFRPRRRDWLRSLAPFDNEAAIARARIARAFSALLIAGLGRLRSLYAARIAGLIVGVRGNPSAAILALEQERDAAIARFITMIDDDKRRAMRAVRSQKRQRRFRIAAPVHRIPRHPVWRPRPPYPKP